MTTLSKPAELGPKLDILMVENEPLDVELALHALRHGGWDARAEVVQTREEMAARLTARTYDLVLADYQLNGWNGAGALGLMRELNRTEPFILVTGTQPTELGVNLADGGVTDFVSKNELDRLPLVVKRALELRQPGCRREQERCPGRPGI